MVSDHTDNLEHQDYPDHNLVSFVKTRRWLRHPLRALQCLKCLCRQFCESQTQSLTNINEDLNLINALMRKPGPDTWYTLQKYSLEWKVTSLYNIVKKMWPTDWLRWVLEMLLKTVNRSSLLCVQGMLYFHPLCPNIWVGVLYITTPFICQFVNGRGKCVNL